MSRTTLSSTVQLQIWLRAGGRCEYPGCNESLWKDHLTLRAMNRAYLAHIIAEKPDGPRGHPELSERLKADPSNIMLLCDSHHRLIDREDVVGHPVELLKQYKRDHEERIERQTAIQPDRRTHILMFGTQIGDRRGVLNYQQACQAVLPERYPADERGIRLDLAGNEISENDPEFWSQTTTFVDRRLGVFLMDSTGPSGLPLNHLSVFALAPIPALIYLGKQIGDLVSADVYQRQRSTADWRWQDLDDEHFDYIVESPTGNQNASVPEVALKLSLSGKVHNRELYRALGRLLPTYTLRISRPRRDFLRAKEQLELFRNHWFRLLAKIREIHGEECCIHLFPAIPNSVAVEIGRTLLPKSDPRIVVYDHAPERTGYRQTIVV